ncbi:hypothetical protein L1887_42491 [Cichorium endivia]|nr:hypothetical protein L1887_42491 [Cichorium endivia]
MDVAEADADARRVVDGVEGVVGVDIETGELGRGVVERIRDGCQSLAIAVDIEREEGAVARLSRSHSSVTEVWVTLRRRSAGTLGACWPNVWRMSSWRRSKSSFCRRSCCSLRMTRMLTTLPDETPWGRRRRGELDQRRLLADEDSHAGIELADGEGERVIIAVGLHGGVDVVGCDLPDVVSRHAAQLAEDPRGQVWWQSRVWIRAWESQRGPLAEKPRLAMNAMQRRSRARCFGCCDERAMRASR